ncbi:MAG: hypothetical protein ACREFD_05520 [Stellaceae bacterium]
MDLTQLKDEAIEEVERYFRSHGGVMPSEDSDEWETQYRRQFELAKQRHAGEVGAAKQPPTAPDADAVDLGELPELHGAPAQIRWAEAVREERLRQIPTRELRLWLAETWIAAKLWVDSRDLSVAEFRHMIEPYYRTYRQEAAGRAAEAAVRRQAEAEAAAAVHRAAEAAGVTPEGVVELVDISPRVAAQPIRGKLADLHIEGRHVRVFETAEPAALLVIDETPSGRTEYGIERDEGLVADLKLAARV